jgi:hypothetical protein
MAMMCLKKRSVDNGRIRASSDPWRQRSPAGSLDMNDPVLMQAHALKIIVCPGGKPASAIDAMIDIDQTLRRRLARRPLAGFHRLLDPASLGAAVLLPALSS